MKYTALALGALTTTAGYAEKLVIVGSDTLGTKMVPQLTEAYVAVGNKTDFEIATERSSQTFSNILAGTANIDWYVQARLQIGRKTPPFLPDLLRSKGGFKALPPKKIPNS